MILENLQFKLVYCWRIFVHFVMKFAIIFDEYRDNVDCEWVFDEIAIVFLRLIQCDEVFFSHNDDLMLIFVRHLAEDVCEDVMNVFVLLRKSLFCREFDIDVVDFDEFVIVQTIDDAIVEFKFKRALLEIELAIMLFQSKHVDDNDMLVESSDQTSNFIHVNIETKLDLSHVSDVENELVIDKTQFDWSS